MATTERIARWSARRWKTVFFGWIALVALVIVVGGQMGTVLLSDVDEMTGEAARGERMLQEAGLTPDASEVLLITSSTHEAGSSEFDAAARDLAAAVRRMPHIENVQWDAPELVAGSGDAQLVTFDIEEAGTTARERLEPVHDAVAAFSKQWRGEFTVQQFGDATAETAIMDVVGEDLVRSEMIAMPITLVILIVTFGALIAAGLPLLIGAVSVGAAISLGSIVSHVLPQSEFAPNLVSMLGIALGVDYTLFLLRREREERAAGHEPREALARAAGSAGKAVFVSGLTVLIALGGLLASGTTLFASMGVAAMLVVGMALLGALFVIPALLGRLGDRVERGRLPLWGRRPRVRPVRESRVWGAVARGAVRRPLLTAVVGVALLASASIPALGMRTGETTIASFPEGLPVVHAYEDLEARFPGSPEPARIVIRNDSAPPADIARAIRSLEDTARNQGIAAGPIRTVTSRDGLVRSVELPLVGAGDQAAAEKSLGALRSTVIPATVGALPGVTVAVTGETANSHDFGETLSEHMPLVFGVVLGSAFLLLACAFRSIVVPLVAVSLNLLSVGAAYGLLVWGFQNENLDGVLPVAGGGVVVSWMPLFLFAILFGLSMDYHVFMLSRIREHVRAGYSTRDAVVKGVQSTASTITSAALVMVSVFGAFAATRIAEMQQMGVGLGAAILIDATLIRGMLLPAIMTLLGRANWYLPRWLGWLPHITAEGTPARAITGSLERAR
jgi:uncharacterized membrane protein YdfJ with MMPL/SSD domain